jgi:hypothetical protein
VLDFDCRTRRARALRFGPPAEAVPLEFPLGTPTGESVLVSLKKLDTIFTTSLVVNW